MIADPIAEETLISLRLLSFEKANLHFNYVRRLPQPWEVDDKNTAEFFALFAIRALTLSVEHSEAAALIARRRAFAIEKTENWLNGVE